MATTKPHPTEIAADDDKLLPPVRYVTSVEGRQIFDEAVRREMGISGEEFIRRWEAGEYGEMADKAENRHIVGLILLIPLARQNS